MLASFLRHLELWLTAVGLLVVWVVALLVPQSIEVWKAATFVALVVSMLHGVLFWVVRRRQRAVRLRTIDELREMMADRVKNQLAVIAMYLPMTQDREMLEMTLGGIHESIDEITRAVDSLNDESLSSWKTHYRGAIASTSAPLPGPTAP